MSEVIETKKTTYTPILLEDGRTVQFPGERQVSKTILEEDGKFGVRFDLRNGATRTLNLDELSEYLQKYSACHGILQKIGDLWAGVKDVDDILIACDEGLDRLRNGAWAAERQSAGDSVSGASIVIQAIAEVTGKPIDEIKTFLKDKLAEGQASGLTRQKLYSSFRNPTSKIGQKIRQLEEERASKSAVVDADALLAELSI